MRKGAPAESALFITKGEAYIVMPGSDKMVAKSAKTIVAPAWVGDLCLSRKRAARLRRLLEGW